MVRLSGSVLFAAALVTIIGLHGPRAAENAREPAG